MVAVELVVLVMRAMDSEAGLRIKSYLPNQTDLKTVLQTEYSIDKSEFEMYNVCLLFLSLSLSFSLSLFFFVSLSLAYEAFVLRLFF